MITDTLSVTIQQSNEQGPELETEGGRCSSSPSRRAQREQRWLRVSWAVPDRQVTGRGKRSAGPATFLSGRGSVKYPTMEALVNSAASYHMPGMGEKRSWACAPGQRCPKAARRGNSGPHQTHLPLFFQLAWQCILFSWRTVRTIVYFVCNIYSTVAPWFMKVIPPSVSIFPTLWLGVQLKHACSPEFNSSSLYF